MATFFGIEKSEEGFSGPSEHELPIDIHLGKLLDWLVDRRKVNANWQSLLKQVQAKVNVAIQNLPADLKEACSGSELNYYGCLSIRDVLKSKVWNDIIKAYEKENLFMAETAQIMQHNVTYEIPLQRKTIDKCSREIDDLNRKQNEYEKAAAATLRKFRDQCAELKIQGNDPRKELLAGSSELPDVYRSVVDMLQSSSARDACAFYEAFVSMLMSFAETTKKPSPLVLPTLQYVIEHGKEVVPPSDLAHDNKGGDGCEAAGVIIDWGADTSVAVPPSTIDWSLDVDAGAGLLDDAAAPHPMGMGMDVSMDGTSSIGAVGTSTINWGDTDASIDVGQPASSINIDWGADVTHPTLAPTGVSIDWSGLDESSASTQVPSLVMEAGGAPHVNLQSVSLHSADSRNALIDDLLELQAFLGQRLAEVQNKQDMVGLEQALQFEGEGKSASALLKYSSDVKAVQDSIETVSAALALLHGPRTRHLLLIKNSSRYLDRLVTSLQRTQEQGPKLRGLALASESKKDEVMGTMKETYPRMRSLIKSTKELQRNIEKSLSTQYNGRPVHIIGEINTIREDVSE